MGAESFGILALNASRGGLTIYQWSGRYFQRLLLLEQSNWKAGAALVHLCLYGAIDWFPLFRSSQYTDVPLFVIMHHSRRVRLVWGTTSVNCDQSIGSKRLLFCQGTKGSFIHTTWEHPWERDPTVLTTLAMHTALLQLHTKEPLFNSTQIPLGHCCQLHIKIHTQ